MECALNLHQAKKAFSTNYLKRLAINLSSLIGKRSWDIYKCTNFLRKFSLVPLVNYRLSTNSLRSESSSTTFPFTTVAALVAADDHLTALGFPGSASLRLVIFFFSSFKVSGSKTMISSTSFLCMISVILLVRDWIRIVVGPSNRRNS